MPSYYVQSNTAMSKLSGEGNKHNPRQTPEDVLSSSLPYLSIFSGRVKLTVNDCNNLDVFSFFVSIKFSGGNMAELQEG